MTGFASKRILAPSFSTAALVLLGLGCLFFLVSRFWPYTMDDAFITFRYARNLAEGHGLVFNPGDFPRTEGVTSPFYAVALALPIRMGWDVLTSAKVLGVAATLLSGLVLALLTARLAEASTNIARPHGRVLGALGALAFWANPYMVAHAVSGMETALGTLALLAFVLCFWNLLALDPARPPGGAILALALSSVIVPLVRPELALLVAVLFAAALALAPAHRRPIAWALAGFVIMGSLYFAARGLYFGLPLPLTFYVKQTGGGRHALRYTLQYLIYIAFLLPLLAGLVLTLATGRRRGRPDIGRSFLIMLTLAAGAQGAYYLTIRPLMGMGMRYHQPLHGVILVLALVGAAMIAAASARLPAHTRNWARLAPFALMLAFCMTSLRSFAAVEERFVRFYAPSIHRGAEIGRALRDAAGGRPLRLAICDCGVIPFHSNFRVTDLVGLNHRAIALDRDPPRAALEELASDEMLFVILVSNEAHGLDALRGYEGLTAEQVTTLGFRYLGSLSINPRYQLLLFGRPTPEVDAVAEALAASGELEAAP